MANRITDRRMLAPSSHPETSMDSTDKKQNHSSLNPNHRVGAKTTMADPDLQTHVIKSTKPASKEKSSTRASKHNNGVEIVKLQNPEKEKEDIKRLSSGAIVKIKELKMSDEEELDLKKPVMELGRRRSLCGSQVDLSDFFSNTCARIVSVDMPPFMQIHAVGRARKTRDSLEKFSSKELALTLKKEFDGVYGPAWHCIVGSSFGSFVTHSVGGFLYFSLDQKIYVLLFKTSVQKAD